MSELIKHVGARIRAQRLFRPGQRILVAVSGGLDSMVLLEVLCELAPEYQWRLTVAHLNHQLRGRSSKADELLVRRTAQALKLPIAVKRTNVRKFARANKLSLEMAARKLRHDFLAHTAARFNNPAIALAHHADDQLEHFFLRLLRGSGGEGLAGMKWRAPSPSDPKLELVRPLLDQPKSALCEYATRKGIRFREDATNASLDIQRNRIRHELLPLLRRKYQPALDRTILRVMDIVGAETEFVAQHAGKWLGHNQGMAARFDELPVAVQRRCLHLQLIGCGVLPNYDLVEELRLQPGHPVSLPATSRDPDRNPKRNLIRLFALRDSKGLVRLHRTEPAGFAGNSLAVESVGRAGEVVFDGTRISWQVQARKFSGLPKPQAGSEIFDADEIGSRVLLRHWQPGDRFQPIGMKTAVKLQDLFTNAKIPRPVRQRLIVALTAKNDVFWVEGLRISERYKLSKSTIRRLHWGWQRL